ncbi:MAG: ABC transporter ATP-binding protein [Xanthomonadales bacterium]|nr:ABC transporter ATP-binding protein [Xanthomonadales bacterium]
MTEPDNKTVIEARALACGIGRQTVIAAFDYVLAAGASVALMGQNGTGKTTFLKTLAGLLPPRGGVLDVLGTGVPSTSARARARIGYLPQETACYPELSVRDHLKLVAGARGISREKIERTLFDFELKEVVGKAMGRLSGGYRQRVMLAMATLHEPELLLLDEPATALDPGNRERFFEQVRNRPTRQTIVFATHRAEEALDFADSIVVLHRGREPTQLNLSADPDAVVLDLADSAGDPARALAGRALQPLGGDRFRVKLNRGESVSDLVASVTGSGIPIRGVQSDREAAMATLTQLISEGDA